MRRAVGRNDKAGKGVTTLFAGYISLAVLDGLLILILGNQTDSKRSASFFHPWSFDASYDFLPLFDGWLEAS